MPCRAASLLNHWFTLQESPGHRPKSLHPYRISFAAPRTAAPILRSGKRVVVAADQQIIQLALGLQHNADRDEQAGSGERHAGLQAHGEQVGQGSQDGQEQSRKQSQAIVGAGQEIRGGFPGRT